MRDAPKIKIPKAELRWHLVQQILQEIQWTILVVGYSGSGPLRLQTAVGVQCGRRLRA
jgi:hypothetical protein